MATFTMVPRNEAERLVMPQRRATLEQYCEYVRAVTPEEAGRLELGPDDKPITERARIETPKPAVPEAVLAVVGQLVAQQGEFERVSIGFPGVVMDGITRTAHGCVKPRSPCPRRAVVSPQAPSAASESAVAWMRLCPGRTS